MCCTFCYRYSNDDRKSFQEKELYKVSASLLLFYEIYLLFNQLVFLIFDWVMTVEVLSNRMRECLLFECGGLGYPTNRFLMFYWKQLPIRNYPKGMRRLVRYRQGVTASSEKKGGQHIQLKVFVCTRKRNWNFLMASGGTSIFYVHKKLMASRSYIRLISYSATKAK